MGLRDDSCWNTRRWVVVRAVAVLVIITSVGGCNTSRYVADFDARLPQLKKIAILPVSVTVASRHTGGALESRPEMVPGVQASAVNMLSSIVRERGRVPIDARSQPTTQPDESLLARRLAFLDAVRESILTHHYDFGREVLIDYETGDVVAVTCPTEADAVLYVYLTGIVPTEGRVGLQATAFVIGAVTGIHMRVSTNEAGVVLILVDAKTECVLWCNRYAAEVNVCKDRGLWLVLDRASTFLLKPQK